MLSGGRQRVRRKDVARASRNESFTPGSYEVFKDEADAASDAPELAEDSVASLLATAPFGFVAGFLGGAVAEPGPPVVVLSQLRRWTPPTTRAIRAPCFPQASVCLIEDQDCSLSLSLSLPLPLPLSPRDSPLGSQARHALALLPARANLLAHKLLRKFNGVFAKNTRL